MSMNFSPAVLAVMRGRNNTTTDTVDHSTVKTSEQKTNIQTKYKYLAVIAIAVFIAIKKGK